MSETKTIHCALSFSSLHIRIERIGEDVQILAQGGDKPHLGCVILSVPRPSLLGDGSISCTSSVLNVTGHKDEVILRDIAERVCVRYNVVTVCSGGFHVDHMTKEQIQEVVQKVAALTL